MDNHEKEIRRLRQALQQKQREMLRIEVEIKRLKVILMSTADVDRPFELSDHHQLETRT